MMKRDMLSSLLSDNVSGSSIIFKNFTEIICSHGYYSDSKKLLRDTNRLIKHFPYFGILHTFRNKLLEFNNTNMNSTFNVCEFTRCFLQELQNESNRIYTALANLIKKQQKPVILTHSCSGMVSGAIRYLQKTGKEITVLQTISHPAREGELQAKALSKYGINVILFEDSAASRVIKKANLFLTGADLVTKKYFINKIGTMALCLLCREFKVPVYLLAGKHRFVKSTSSLPDGIDKEKKNPAEVSGLKLKRLQVLNYYFEQIPVSLCTMI